MCRKHRFRSCCPSAPAKCCSMLTTGISSVCHLTDGPSYLRGTSDRQKPGKSAIATVQEYFISSFGLLAWVGMASHHRGEDSRNVAHPPVCGTTSYQECDMAGIIEPWCWTGETFCHRPKSLGRRFDQSSPPQGSSATRCVI
jgi:hypothetical protein